MESLFWNYGTVFPNDVLKVTLWRPLSLHYCICTGGLDSDLLCLCAMCCGC